MQRSLLQWWKSLPPEGLAFPFAIASTIIRGTIFRVPIVGIWLLTARRHFGNWISSVVPALPLDLASSTFFSTWRAAFPFYRRVSSYTYPITVVATLVADGIMTSRSGTFSGTDGGILYFVDDYWNIILYAFVCPVYISIAVCLIITSMRSWAQINTFVELEVTGGAVEYSMKRAGPITKAALFVTISFFVSGFTISEFLAQLIIMKTDHLYWFFSRTPSGDVTLNIAGAYYLYSNAILLFVTAMAGLCYVAMSVEVFHLAYELKLRADADSSTSAPMTGEDLQLIENKIKGHIAPFMLCYVLAKGLVLVYAVNILIWRISPMGRVNNVNLAIFALVVVGVILLSFPRLRLVSVWHEIKCSRGEEKSLENFQSNDLRRIRLILNFLFAILLGSILQLQYGVSTLGQILKRIGGLID